VFEIMLWDSLGLLPALISRNIVFWGKMYCNSQLVTLRSASL